MSIYNFLVSYIWKIEYFLYSIYLLSFLNLKIKIFTSIAIFTLAFLFSLPGSFAETKWTDWNNGVYGWKYVTTDAQRAAATKAWITIDPNTWAYNSDSIKAFQALNGITVDGKIWPETSAKLTSLAGNTASPTGNVPGNANQVGNSSSSPEWPTTVVVTEKIPGATCDCIAQTTGNNLSASVTSCSDPKTRKYSCTVGKWLSGFQDIFREITKWVVYITMLLWVMAIAGAGILWAWGSESEEYTKKAKGWVVNILIGLVILFTFRYILWFIAPWIFQ